MKQLNDLLPCVVLLSVFWIGLPLLPGGGESFAQPACEDSSLTDEDSHNADTDVDDDDDGLIEICNLEGLNNVRYNPGGTGYYTAWDAPDSTGCPTSGGCRGYELTADLNFTDTSADGYVSAWTTGTGWLPLTSFNGVFEGNGHVIENLYINHPGSGVHGLFSTIGTTGEVRNLGLTGNDMSVLGGNLVGALAGVVDGLVTSCYSTGAITGPPSGNAAVGGLIGLAGTTAKVFNCHATGTVNGRGGLKIGGLVGTLAGMVSNCYATGNVEGFGIKRGGLIGFLDGGSVSNCYATGDVTGSGNFKGRLAGYGSSSSSVSNSYATGALTGIGTSVRPLVGQTPGSLRNSYWENMGAETSEDTRDRTSAQLKAFTQASTSDVAEDRWSTDDWDFGASSQYPALKSLDFDDDGTTRIQGYLLCGQPGDRAGCGVSIEATVDEATEGTDIFFALTRRGRATVTAGDLTVSVMVSDGDGDFLASDELDLTVVIPEGDSTKDFTVMTDDDAEGEADGILTATVSANPAYEVAEPSSATVVIEDDDLPVVSIVKTTDAVEGDGTSAVSAVFTVSRDETNTAPLDVKVGLAFSEDFSSSETSSEPTVTINAGDTSVTLTVGVMDNDIDQEEGTITATLVAVTSVLTYRISEDSPVATAAITDDELPVVSIVKITDAKEGNGASAVSAMFTVSRIGLTTNPLDVKVGLTFSNGFSSSAGTEATVTIDANESSVTLEVGVTDNDVDQVDGTITARLVEIATYDISTTAMSASASIADDELPVVSIVKATNAKEGTAGSGVSAVFTVSRVGDTTNPLDVKVGLTLSDGFSSSAGTEATVTIDANENAVAFEVGVTNNDMDQVDGTITVMLVKIATYDISMTAMSASASIADDDLPVVSIVKTTNAKEGAAGSGVSAVFTVSRVGLTTNPLDVKVGLAFSDGFSSSDGTEATVTIDANENAVAFEVGVTNNDMDQVDGTITARLLAFTSTATYNISMTAMSASASIVDDDLPVISIVKTTDAKEGAAGSGVSAVFTVSRVGDATDALDVKVGLAFSDGYSSSVRISETLVTIDANENSATLEVGVADNDGDQVDGTITVRLLAVPWTPMYDISMTAMSASASIADDDLPLVSIGKTTDAKEGVSGSAVSAVFRVYRSNLTTNPLDVKIGLVFSDGFSSSVGISEATVTINASEYSAALEVGVTDNDVDQVDGTITATLVVFTPTTYQIVSSSHAEATITDDDPPSITSFAIGDSSSSVIDEAAKMITVTVPQGTALTNVKPVVVTVRSDAAVTPSGAQTFTVDVAVPYTVTDWDTPVTYQVTVEEEAGIPPGVPGGFSAAAGIEEVTLSWTPPTELGTGDALSRYEYRQTQGATVSGWVAVDSTATMQVVGSLTAGAVYGFEVRAVGSRGPTERSHDKDGGYASGSAGPDIW